MPFHASGWSRRGMLAVGTSIGVVALMIAIEGAILRWMGFHPLRDPSAYSVIQFCPPVGNRPALSVFWSRVEARKGGLVHYVQVHQSPLGGKSVYFRWPDLTPRSATWTGSEGKLAISSQEGTIFTWDTSEQDQPPRALGEHPGCAMLLAASADGRWLASANESLIRVWNMQTRQLAWTRDDLVVRSLVMHPGLSIVCGTAHGSVWQLDLATGGTLREVARHAAAVDGVAVSGDGQRLASVGNDRQLVLSDWDQAQPLWSRAHHPNGALCFSPAGNVIISSGFHNNGWALVTWDAATGRRQSNLMGHRNVILGVTCTPDNTLYSWSSDGALRTWRLERAEPVQVLTPDPPC